MERKRLAQHATALAISGTSFLLGGCIYGGPEKNIADGEYHNKEGTITVSYPTPLGADHETCQPQITIRMPEMARNELATPTVVLREETLDLVPGSCERR